jgi:hypothetical protein
MVKNSALRLPVPMKSAECLFSASIRQKVKEENSEATQKEIKLLLAKAWVDLNPEERQPWQLKSAEDGERWTREYSEYENRTKELCEDFTDTELRFVLDKCFKADGLTALVDKCIAKDISAFSSLEGSRGKNKTPKLKILCRSRPAGCQSAADLLQYLVTVTLIQLSSLGMFANCDMTVCARSRQISSGNQIWNIGGKSSKERLPLTLLTA